MFGRTIFMDLTGDLDMASEPLLSSQVRQVQYAGFDLVVIDLAGLDSIDVRGVRALI